MARLVLPSDSSAPSPPDANLPGCRIKIPNHLGQLYAGHFFGGAIHRGCSSECKAQIWGDKIGDEKFSGALLRQ